MALSCVGDRVPPICFRRARQVFLDHVDPVFFFPLVTYLHVLIWLHIPCIPIGLGSLLVDLLSPVVISCRISLSSYMMWIYGLWLRVWSFICRDVSWPWWGSILWFEKRLVQWRWLSPSGDVVAQICKWPNLRSRHPRTTCATKCLVWSGLPQGARGAWGYSVVPNKEKPKQLWKGSEGILLYPKEGNLCQSKT
jgi:hypothetical protein